MPRRLTSRTVGPTLVVVVAIATLGGCVSSEKSRYERHLSVMVSPEPTTTNVATGALADD